MITIFVKFSVDLTHVLTIIWLDGLHSIQCACMHTVMVYIGHGVMMRADSGKAASYQCMHGYNTLYYAYYNGVACTGCENVMHMSACMGFKRKHALNIIMYN